MRITNEIPENWQELCISGPSDRFLTCESQPRGWLSLFVMDKIKGLGGGGYGIFQIILVVYFSITI